MLETALGKAVGAHIEGGDQSCICSTSYNVRRLIASTH